MTNKSLKAGDNSALWVDEKGYQLITQLRTLKAASSKSDVGEH